MCKAARVVMIEMVKKHIKDIIIAGGVFVPLIDYVRHIMLASPQGLNVLDLPHNQQLILLALILAPLLILRIIYPSAFCHRGRKH
jgi:hypothetical protein